MEPLTISGATIASKKLLDTIAKLLHTRLEAPLKARAEAETAVIKEEGRHQLTLQQAQNIACEIKKIFDLQTAYQNNIQYLYAYEKQMHRAGIKNPHGLHHAYAQRR